jgi:hypothetical protein
MAAGSRITHTCSKSMVAMNMSHAALLVLGLHSVGACHDGAAVLTYAQLTTRMRVTATATAPLFLQKSKLIHKAQAIAA